ncbi:cbb3-type cytochrome oxidase maturation protein [Natronocella acetinitrilica]|jgi:cbb3-type cytochrome oxidase maturation protein|uniref:Cbb3-type cytochrome oxidase maturation protein n=1 Tax=Natronocella acetinitrilica TaxID=414046 RepID=A0AAE3G594_9GAMM|nr:cbb3-type cytochrome oxidase assembly protein CcoS [Natronocella acetinitrilica]MCP1674653.1 cbb3-type cytochrome oxidase maturation protein [Natronocella acetinitrilica]
MNIIYVSIPISLILLGVGIWFFFWAVRSGQYDDLDSPAYSILLDEETDRKRQRKSRAKDQDEQQ